MKASRLESELLVQPGYELREVQTLSGAITVMQSSVASSQLPAPAMASRQLSDTAPSSPGRATNTTTFGSVLSAKIDTQRPASTDSRLPSNGPGAAVSQVVSNKKAETAKPKHEEQKGDDLGPTQTPPVTEILPQHPTAATAQGNFRPQEEDLGKVSVAGIAGYENSVETAQAVTCGAVPANGGDAAGLNPAESASSATETTGPQQQTSVTTSSPETQPYAATQNARGTDQQKTTDCPGNAASPPGGEASPSSTGRSFESLFSSAAQPRQGQTLASTTATRDSAKLQNPPQAGSPGAARSEAPPPVSERRPENDGGAAATQLTAPTLAEQSDVPGRIVEAQLKPAPPGALPANSSVVRSGEAVSRRSSDGNNRTARKPDASATKPPQPSLDMTSDEGQPRSTMSDSTADKAHLGQPAATITTHDGQDRPATTTNAMLPEAVRAAANTADAKDAKPQAASAAPTSTPAESVPAAPAVIQSARVLERMGQSEMRLGLNSNNFGNIELHTSVNQDRVGASIATSHTDLRAAMMAEMPSLERAMAQHQLKLDNLNLDSRTGSQNRDGGAASGDQSPRSSTQYAGEVSEFGDDAAAQDVTLPQAWTAPHSRGLNVHA